MKPPDTSRSWAVTQLLMRGANVSRAIRWLRTHYRKAMSIETLAAKCAKGVTTFHRQFKRVTGLSPLQF